MVLVRILGILENNRFIEKQSARAIFRKNINRTYDESNDIKTVFYEIYQEYRTRISSRYIFGESKVFSFMNIGRFHKKSNRCKRVTNISSAAKEVRSTKPYNY